MREVYPVAGMTFDWLAFIVYGSEMHAHHLMMANTQYIGRRFFRGNEVIRVPDLPLAAAVGLPPWKQYGEGASK